ncbi:MAG: DUF1801 domain-containing protein [Planctomycetes bacterium]|nr:DUF1801 domain-containing protein [Planctomycetota bacterium]
MQSQAHTVAAYLASLPADRRAAIEAVRKVILDNLDDGYAEGMQYGMIGYCVPHSRFPAGYHCDPTQPLPFAGLASQKNHMSVYLMGVYSDGKDHMSNWFREAWRATGKKLDMGKCCIRFKKLEDAALDVIGEAIRRLPVDTYLDYYRQAMAQNAERKSARKPVKKAAPATKKAAAKSKTAPRASKTSALVVASALANKGRGKSSGKVAAKKRGAAR